MADISVVKSMSEIRLCDFGRTVRVTNILHDVIGMLRSYRVENRGASLVWIGIGTKKEICIHINSTIIEFLD